MKQSINENIILTNETFGNSVGKSLLGDNKYDTESLLNQALNLYDEIDELKEEGFDILTSIKNQEVESEQESLLFIQGRMGMIDAIGDITVFLVGLSVYIDNFFNFDSSFPNGEGYIDLSELTYLDIIGMLRSNTDNITVSIRNERELDLLKNEIFNMIVLIMSICKHFNIDIEEVVDRITQSNLSKVCKTKEQLDKTVKFYRDKGLDIYIKESPVLQDNGEYQYVVYSSYEQTVGNKIYRANKFLKCIDWFEPKLEDM